MRECAYCGKPITRRATKGGREREYCTNSCKQRAYKARHPEKVYVEQAMRRVRKRQWEEYPRLAPWVEDLQRAQKQIEDLKSDKFMTEVNNDSLRLEINQLQREVVRLHWQLAKAEAEIARLNTLLDYHSKRKKD